MSNEKKIEMGKQYRYRGNGDTPGKLVDVLTTTRQNKEFPVISMSRNTGAINTHTIYGDYFDKDTESGYDLIEVSPYEDYGIDEPVMVNDLNGAEYKRHFAGISDSGKPLAFAGGHTSWTNTNALTPWDCCRRPTKEELER